MMRPPEKMTPSQRRQEITDILARGLLRLMALRSRKTMAYSKNSLDSLREESVTADKR
jgi:hypothetical protein